MALATQFCLSVFAQNTKRSALRSLSRKSLVVFSTFMFHSRNMKQVLMISLLFSCTVLHAQLNEDFQDGDFTNNPVWTGSNNGNDFTIVDNKLRSNSSAASTNFFLSTSNTLASNVQWELWINLQFNTSGSNYTDIYVISDKADLKATLINGYFVRIGNTDDEISLYKRSGTAGSSFKIIDGANGSVGASNNTIKIKLKRDNAGTFTLEREVVTSTSSPFTEGSVTDLAHNTSSHFGILIQQSTASFFLKHFFDDVKITSIVSDTSPPVVSSVSNIDSNTLEVSFNEAMDSTSAKTALNYLIDNYAGAVLQVQTTNNPARFILRLANALAEGTHLVSAINVKDRNGNLIGLNNNGSFTYIKPFIAKFGDVVINEIFADPSPQIDLPSVEFAELRNNTNHSISLKNWKFTDSGSSATFGEIKIEPQSFLIISAKADTAEYKSFGRVVGLSPWPSLNNSGEILKLISPENLIVDSVHYSDTWYRNSTKKQGGWTLERKDPKSKCQGILNWYAAVDSAGGTPGRENSVYVPGYDMMVLSPDSLKQLSDTSITIYFNKHLDSSTLLPENFEIIPNTSSVRKITASPDFKMLTLTYDKKFQSGTEYQLKLNNLKDCSGTLIRNHPERLIFKTSKPSPVIEIIDTAMLVITEIFADPSPEIHLPLAEFIEIYNPSKDAVDLDKWTLNDPATKVTFRAQKILPGEYLILCPIADTIHYKPFGKVIGLSPWPSLNNNSDQISLKSFKNRLVDSLAYSDTWYKNDSKKTGGWSLERVDLKSACDNFFNWTASIDTNGGTPGKQNSVNIAEYDSLGLQADSLILTSDTTVNIYFNKHLNSSTLVAQNFKLLPGTNLLNKVTSDTELRKVTLTYKEKFQAATEYLISLSDLKDCSGNPMKSKQTLGFKTSQPPPPVAVRPDTATILITEIFADPSPEIGLPLTEFIEIYNPSKDTVNLDKWTINDPSTKATIRAQRILPGEYLILCPVADTVHYKPFGRVLGINPWPSLNNSADQISLKSFQNRLVDSIAYSDTWYRNTSKKPGGWSLEKIDLKSVCEDFFNWTASLDTMGGTPGKINSANILDYDLLALKADSLKLISDTAVKLYFNKHLNGATLVADYFNLSPHNVIKKITSDAELKEVVLTYEKKFQAGTEYQLIVSKLRDCSGTHISDSPSLKFKTSPLPPPVPEKADTARILITEIFADPSPEVGLPLAEFIELYNPGRETVDLDKWILSDPATRGIVSNTTIAPGAYLILCPVADTLHFKQFGKTKGIAPWPSLGNNGDRVTLKSFSQRLVDSIAYSDKWYKNKIKKNGGWSLEKIDVLNTYCNGFYNWASSTDDSGGTPGRANSVNVVPDTFRQVKIDSVIHTSDSSLIVFLNSIPDTAHIKLSQFVLNNKIGNATSIFIEEDYKKIHLNFGSKFLEGVSYVLTADSIFSCGGEKITEVNNHGSFTIPVIPELKYPIIINEILADPLPQIGLPEIEFVELYNPTEKTVSLKGMSYGDEGVQHTFTDGEIGPKSYLILCPQKDTLSFSALGKVLGLPIWPTLGNEKDILTLKNNKGRELQRVAYNTGWYKDTGKKMGGYSLERINAASICKDFQNWGASKDLTGGTPGRENSIHESASAEGLKLLEVVLADSVTLLLTFNKPVDSLSASAPGNFQLNNGVGKPDSATPISPLFEQVMLKLKEPLTRGHLYRVEVADLRDCTGSGVLADFNSRDFFFTEKIAKNAILVNEILFNPRPGGVDFVEIYNNTKHTLDLQDLLIATIVKDTVSSIKRISLKQLLFEPGHYISVTSDPEVVKKEYNVENPDKLIKATLPQFNDDKGTVVLLSNGGRVDQLDYTEKMHFQLLKNFDGVSLERSSFKRNTNETGNFRSATAASGFATPGYKNSQYNDNLTGAEEFALTSRTFSPDNDGFEDLLQVSYHMPAPGMVANVKIFNDKGVLIKNLLNNSTLNSTGMFIWDGLNEFNSPVGTGVYFLHAEIFDTNGNLKKFRRSFALAAKL